MSIHDGHRDRMRRQLKTSGMDSLSDVQVLEVLLYYAAPRGDTNPTAHALLSRFGTLDSVFSAPESELKKVNGVGDAAAQLIRLVPQVARRCLMSAQIEILDTTSKCGQYLLPYFHGESEEVVYLLCLDAKCKALDQMYKLMDVCQTCVFVNRQETADRLGEAMRGLGHEVGVIRGGDMEKKERVRILNEFKEGKIKVLICTDLLSRGIDILDVTLVVNFDIPKKGENMVGERGGGEV